MAIENINPATLKQLRTDAGLSQESLAKTSKVSKKTIARIESGKSTANTHSVTKLAKALGVRLEDLAEPSDQVEKAVWWFSRYCTTKFLLHENTRIALQMVEKNYGLSYNAQIQLAPLFAALLAEGSFEWRKQKIEQVDHMVKELEKADYGHTLFYLATSRASDATDLERDSIKERDLFGKRVKDEAFSEGLSPESDPFTEYLRHLAAQCSSQTIKILPEANETSDYDNHDCWMTNVDFGNSSVNYSIGSEELFSLTDSANNEDFDWAWRALGRGHVQISDIPEDLLGDDKAKERAAWFRSRIPQDEQEKLKKSKRAFDACALELTSNIGKGDSDGISDASTKTKEG